MATRQHAYAGSTARHDAIPTIGAVRAGRIVSGLVILFLLQDSLIKVLNLDVAVDATIELGYPESLVIPIGVTLLACTALYMFPRTAVVGAILLTGFLGGAIATQVRIEEPWFLLPTTMAILVWVGLALRDARVRSFLL
ncbi:MAG TPA: DoxX family protein [Thermomicrobiales bacterium]|nr:DoxX family protein [Thermomicrobiales bacterium]